MRRSFAVLLVILPLLAAGCSSGTAAPNGVGASITSASVTSSSITGSSSVIASSAISSEVVVLDVRTPAEFTAGHLQGATNISLADDFAGAIANLDRGVPYLVYCRTGVRSAEAASVMKAAGFTDVTDAGAMESAARSTGLQVVTD